MVAHEIEIMALPLNDETKRCPKCDADVPLSQFNRRANGRWSPYCKPCMSAYCKAHYAKNAQSHNARRIEADRSYQTRNLACVRAELSARPCIDCGESDPAVLEFESVDSHRSQVVHLIGRGAGLDTLKREMTRCVIRCGSCSRRRAARQFARPDGISPFPGCSSAW
jgi:hypothetical protein